MTVTTAKWTLAEYHQIVEAGFLRDRQVELLNGDMIEMPPEGPEHAQLSTDAADDLRQLLGSQALVRDAKPITLPHSGSEPQPDLAIVEPVREVYRSRHPYPSDVFWLIEYSNTSLAKDLDTKRKTYAQAGIREYWVVDLKTRLVKVFRDPIEGDYRSELTFQTGEISPLAFPDMQVSVQKLLGRWS